MKIVIEVEGGVVQAVYSDATLEAWEVELIGHDNLKEKGFGIAVRNALVDETTFGMHEVTDKYANRPQVAFVTLNNQYVAEIAADRKTVKVGCTTFDADKVFLVADVLRK